MRQFAKGSGILAVLVAIGLAGCDTSSLEGPEGNEGGEEGGTQLTLTQTYDEVRNGVRLILAYDSQQNAFVGTASNTTAALIRQVRVEVHLSNGVELGPTTPTDLSPDQSIPINLQATGSGFTTWSAHPETG